MRKVKYNAAFCCVGLVLLAVGLAAGISFLIAFGAFFGSIELGLATARYIQLRKSSRQEPQP